MFGSIDFEPKLERLSVLLVDDDCIDRQGIIRVLNKVDMDVNITEAKTVDEALLHFAKTHFDLVLLDYRLPQRSGKQMLIELRRLPKHTSTAIIIMSTAADEDVALECLKEGAQDFLIKSEISESRLRRALLQANTRFELEKQLHISCEKVKFMAEKDALTGLPNRYYFDEFLKLIIEGNERGEQQIVLLVFDVDNFKMVNDNYGHDAGDELLRRVASRVHSCLRGVEMFARLGGDEFAVAVTNIGAESGASQIARRILKMLNKPIELGDITVHVSASIGIAIHPDNGASAEEVFKHADIAMYRAKTLGGNQACFFEAEMQEQFTRRVRVENDLRVALEKKEFCLYYQPVFSPNTGELVGFEALIRWLKDGVLVPPDEFIPISEETRQIIEVGRWVLEEAIAFLAKWNSEHQMDLTMAINVSPVQLHDENFALLLEQLIEKYCVAANAINIELTETALLADNAKSNTALARISELGCHLALDDFGTGYSSISHLHKYPIAVVKIDRSLMPNNDISGKKMALVKGLVAMAKILGLDVVVEGVETQVQAEFCRSLGVGFVQGYFYSKPLPEDEIIKRYL